MVRRKAAVTKQKTTAKGDSVEFKLALAVLIFGVLTAFCSICKLGNITVLMGLVTVAAVLMMARRK